DPFMGGGTPLIEANRLCCDVVGFDINPMSYWIVRQEIEHLNLVAYRHAATKLREELEVEIGHLYRTRCMECGSTQANAKYFLWVKVQACCRCGQDIDLFPGFLISEDRRHPKNVFLCQVCGELTEVGDRKQPGNCFSCGQALTLQGPARRNHCICPHCSADNKYPDARLGPPQHRMFALEYYCSECKKGHSGRFFKKPDDLDQAKFAEVKALVSEMQLQFVPEDEILPGVESDRLHRWGYRHYREMFNARQLLGLELSCRLITKQKDQRIKNALATNLSDLLRYQNMLLAAADGQTLSKNSSRASLIAMLPLKSNIKGDAKFRCQLGGNGLATSETMAFLPKNGWLSYLAAMPVRSNGPLKVSMRFSPIPRISAMCSMPS
ncbi:MAG: hypothetical protein HY743_00865, partial [Deltaproteobacteria bacterium]|nr:hypothetical protein [Deltaproteobacteria bacterium]